MSDQVIILKPTITYALLRSLGQFMIIGAVVVVYLYFKLDLVLLIITLPVLIIFARIVYWSLVRYEISPVQIKYTRGVFQRQVDFLEMYRIKDFDQTQSLLMNIFGIMHIRLMTSDISHPMLELRGIPKSNIADMLRHLVEKSRKENRVYAID